LSEKAWLVKPEIAEKMVKAVERKTKEEKPEKGGREEGAEEEEETKRRHVRISVEAPDGKLTEIFRGVIKPLNDEGAEVHVVVNVEAEGEISDQTLKMKVKETLQQLGTKFEVKDE